MNEADAERNEKLRHIGNFLHETTPIFADEENNVIERTVGPVGDANRFEFIFIFLCKKKNKKKTAPFSATTHRVHAAKSTATWT